MRRAPDPLTGDGSAGTGRGAGCELGGGPRPGLPGSPSTGPSHAVTRSAERSARVSLSAQGKVGGRVGTPLKPRTLKWRPRPQVCPTAGIGGQGCPGARTPRNKLGAFSHIAPSAGPLSRGDRPRVLHSLRSSGLSVVRLGFDVLPSVSRAGFLLRGAHALPPAPSSGQCPPESHSFLDTSSHPLGNSQDRPLARGWPSCVRPAGRRGLDRVDASARCRSRLEP